MYLYIITILIIHIYSSVSEAPPNIVFILTDDLGFNDISFHNHRVISPMLNRLAKSGVILENYYSQPVGVGTRASLLTGRYPIHVGLQNVHSIEPNWELGLPLNFTLLPERLKKLGYKTHIVGKWNLGHHKQEYLPISRGFDSHFGYYTSALDNFQHTSWDVYPRPAPSWALDLHNSTLNTTRCVREYNGTHSMELYRHEAARIIRNHDVTTPLFLYLSLQAVHQPNRIPDSFNFLYPQMETISRKLVLSTVSLMDGVVWDVYHELQSKGSSFWKNTVIVFTSDNGGWPTPGSRGNNFPLRGGKYTLFEGGLRVPAFVHSPLVKKPGRVEWGLFHSADWYSTLLRLAGAVDSESLDGHDQWDMISEGVGTQRIEILHNIETDSNGVTTSAIRYGSWKLLTGRWANCSQYSDPYYCSWIPSPTYAEFYYFSLSDEGYLPFLGRDISYKPRVTNREYSPLMLFHIESDPKELWDKSQDYPNIVSLLLNRLDEYYDSMTSPLTVYTSEKWRQVAIENQCLLPWNTD